MSKQSKLDAAIGKNIDDSIGVRSEEKTPPAPPTKDPRIEGVKAHKDARTIRLDRIMPDPDQPRKEFKEEELASLANSLKLDGQLQPIRVRWDSVALTYVIIAGERRWQAAKIAELVTLDCVIETRELTPGAKLAHQIIENMIREDLSEIEKANGVRDLMRIENLKQKEVAERLQIHPSRVTRLLALLELPAEVQDLVHEGQLPAATAHKLTELTEASDQTETAQRIVDEGLTRDSAAREIRVLVEQREDERIQDEADSAPDPEFSEDIEGASLKKPKPAAKAKGKPTEKKKAKVKTIQVFNLSSYKITAERAKGIDPEGLLNALDMAAEQIRMSLEDKAKREPVKV